MLIRAHRAVGTGVLQAEERPVPEPGPGQVLLRVRTCGVCHTDLHVCEGELPPRPLPIVPGHEVVGTVEAVGPGIPADVAPAPGARVGLPWLHQTCGICRFCRSGRENLCTNIRFTGYDADGGYAEYALAPAGFVYPLPANYDDEAAAPLLCSGIVGYRAVRRAGVRPGERVGLLGFGATAHIVLQVLVAWGCEVAVWSRGARHRELAAQLGAAWTGRYDSEPPWPVERAIIFSPVGETVVEALRHLDAGGVAAIAAVHLSPIPTFDHDRLLYGEREIRSVTASTRQDAVDFLRLAERIPLRVHTQVYPLAEAEPALVAVKIGRIDGAAVLAVQQGD